MLGFPPVHLQIGDDICIVPMADTVAIGKVNCCNFDCPCSFPRFAGTISQGYCNGTTIAEDKFPDRFLPVHCRAV